MLLLQKGDVISWWTDLVLRYLMLALYRELERAYSTPRWHPQFVMHAVLPIKRKDDIRELTEIRHATIFHAENQGIKRMADKWSKLSSVPWCSLIF